MIRMNEELEKIFELKATLEKVFFREFVINFEFPKELNQTHIKTIMMLYFKDSCPMTIVSEKTNLEKGSFTSVANKLLKLEYIEKKRDEYDKRVYKLNLTEKGKVLAIKIGKAHSNHIENMLSELSEIEKKSYFDSLSVINETTKNFLK